MITRAQIKPIADRLQALIDAAKNPVVPGAVPQWMANEGCPVEDFKDDFDDDSIDPVKYPIDGTGPLVPSANAKWFMGWPCQPQDCTISNSVLTINQDRSGDGGLSLVTCPHGFPGSGRMFRGTRCYQARVRYDSSAVIPDRFPNIGGVFWSNSGKLMRWWMDNIRTARNLPELLCCDMNFLESPKIDGKPRILMSCGDYWHGPRPGAPTIEDWAAHFTMIEHPEKAWADDYINDYIPRFDTRDWHDYGCKHTSALDSGGVGGRKNFIDGIHIEQMDQTWRPGEMFSGLDDDDRYLILGTALLHKAEYDHVIVGRP